MRRRDRGAGVPAAALREVFAGLGDRHSNSGLALRPDPRSTQEARGSTHDAAGVRFVRRATLLRIVPGYVAGLVDVPQSGAGDRTPTLAKVLALALLVAIGDCDKRHRIMDLFTRSQTGEDRPYVDVVDLCLNLLRYSADPLVAETARALGDLLLSSRPPLVGAVPQARARQAEDSRSLWTTAATLASSRG